MAGLRAQATAMAAQSYKTPGGGSTSELALWTQPGSAESILNGLATLDAVAGHQSDVLAQLRVAREQQRAAATTAKDAVDRAATTLASLEADKQAVLEAADRAQQVLVALQAQQAQVVQAAKDAAAAQAAAQRAADLAQQANGAAASAAAFRAQGTAPSAPVTLGAPAGSQAAQVAVRTALAQLGKPYVFGAAGPSTFDCSGLTMFAYAAAGVALPHYTGAQIGIGRRVGWGELQPGDLVFFPGHEGMYIGNGQMVHAPHTGTVVQVATLSGYWQGQFVGASRPTG